MKWQHKTKVLASAGSCQHLPALLPALALAITCQHFLPALASTCQHFCQHLPALLASTCQHFCQHLPSLASTSASTCQHLPALLASTCQHLQKNQFSILPKNNFLSNKNIFCDQNCKNSERTGSGPRAYWQVCVVAL